MEGRKYNCVSTSVFGSIFTQEKKRCREPRGHGCGVQTGHTGADSFTWLIHIRVQTRGRSLRRQLVVRSDLAAASRITNCSLTAYCVLMACQGPRGLQQMREVSQTEMTGGEPDAPVT